MYCAIDFGTSNSGIAVPVANTPRGAVRLLEVEPGHPTMPTAVFYVVEGLAPHEAPRRLYGRAAVAAYVERTEGRLMRSMKSILGSSLVDQRTDLGAGHSVSYREVLAGYLRQLKQQAEAHVGRAIEQAVLGRPVFFVDDDAERDAKAQAALEAAARSVGFVEVQFQYEPIAAALDYEQRATREQIVLVADIGGGTSDFSLVRVGPERRVRTDRRGDILANHGVHAAGTDFDRHIELAWILPTCGHKSLGPAKRGQAPREVPSRVYFDLATWHLINTVYLPQRVSELARMRDFYGDVRLHERLMRVVTQRLGHALAALAEQAKIEIADGGQTHLALKAIEAGLAVELTQGQAIVAIDADLARVVAAARETLRQASLAADAIDVLYLTGGSTGLSPLVQRLAALCPDAQLMRGDRFASVAQGLGLHAQRLFA
ncbi:MAG: Hsp70 family protein [Pseudomonadota bacterium]